MTRCLTARVIMHRQNILVALKHVGACKSNYTASTADSRLVSVKHFLREGTSQNHHVNTSYFHTKFLGIICTDSTTLESQAVVLDVRSIKGLIETNFNLQKIEILFGFCYKTYCTGILTPTPYGRGGGGGRRRRRRRRRKRRRRKRE